MNSLLFIAITYPVLFLLARAFGPVQVRDALHYTPRETWLSVAVVALITAGLMAL